MCRPSARTVDSPHRPRPQSRGGKQSPAGAIKSATRSARGHYRIARIDPHVLPKTSQIQLPEGPDLGGLLRLRWRLNAYRPAICRAGGSVPPSRVVGRPVRVIIHRQTGDSVGQPSSEQTEGWRPSRSAPGVSTSGAGWWALRHLVAAGRPVRVPCLHPRAGGRCEKSRTCRGRSSTPL